MYGVILPLFDTSTRSIKNIKISESILEAINLSYTKVKIDDNVLIENCKIRKAQGVSNQNGFPGWVANCSSQNFENISSVKRIKVSDIDPLQKIFLSIVRKIFRQRGRGRKENALYKGGFGQNYDSKNIDRILSKMINHGVIKIVPGNEGDIYAPIRQHSGRMARILAELSLSEDPLWLEILDLKR